MMLVVNQLSMKPGELGELLTKIYMLQLLSIFCSWGYLVYLLQVCFLVSGILITDVLSSSEQKWMQLPQLIPLISYLYGVSLCYLL